MVVDGILFSVVTDATWRIPPSGGKTDIRLGLRITNAEEEKVRLFLFHAIQPILIDERGRTVLLGGGANHVLKGGTWVTPVLAIGDTYTVSHPNAGLHNQDGHVWLSMDDGFGGYWSFSDLHPGKYYVRMKYRYKNDSPVRAGVPVWLGEVLTDPLAVEITRQGPRSASPHNFLSELPPAI